MKKSKRNDFVSLKTQVFFTEKNENGLQLSYYVNDTQLKAVSKIKALSGIYITSNLPLSMQVNKCAKKANSVLGFIIQTVSPKSPEFVFETL